MRAITLGFPFFISNVIWRCQSCTSHTKIIYCCVRHILPLVFRSHIHRMHVQPYTYAKNMILFNENTNVAPLSYIGLLHRLWCKSYTSTTDKDNWICFSACGFCFGLTLVRWMMWHCSRLLSTQFATSRFPIKQYSVDCVYACVRYLPISSSKNHFHLPFVSVFTNNWNNNLLILFNYRFNLWANRYV